MSRASSPLQPDALAHYTNAAAQLVDYPELGSPEHEARMRERQSRMLDAIRNGQWSTLSWADETTPAFIQLAHDAQSIIDLGAEAGFYAALALQTSAKLQTLQLVEPDPVYVAQLRASFASSHREIDQSPVEIDVHEAAAGASHGTLRLTKPRGLSATAAQVDGVVINVPMTTIDQLNEQSPSQLIKIDIEGAEAAALAGAVRTMHTHHPRILMEFHPWADTIVPNSRERIRTIAHDAGYTIYRFQPDGRATKTDRIGGRLYLHPPGTPSPAWCDA